MNQNQELEVAAQLQEEQNPELMMQEEQNQAQEEFQWPEFLPPADPENQPMPEVQEQEQQEHNDILNSQGSAQQGNMMEMEMEPNPEPEQATQEISIA